ncbi:hypothetical protein GLOTRDRAFT_127978 [Gloeophyllum trabeum ATCC 11539]|uniref:Uncharacterized protein n=1 Tax=Gloeophyllum trabeum (strain ATCC 11539 / FP-39264 / Madison 617) TaxID=670483 RepID=S7QCL3_GLOTA|nr:uncharacterized protein GLOTRDRAFT_127978 [Gloeophyllum trabeum ATCC 11539]EPQ57621.1 hypothetical protein GLOTRDRAFT_127978 [Gloeophyllum trabeum ATCC 11539]
MSILLVTRELPSSPAVGAFISNLSASNAKGLPNAFFLHFLVMNGKTEASPNAYLNLARLYAPTQSVVLFPDDISNRPNFTSPTSAALLSDFSSPSVLVGSDDHTSFPFEPLAPLALDRVFPLWCDERFISGSRELDWTEYLWQVWLETFGDVSVYNTAQWSEALPATRAVSGKPSPAPLGALSRKIHTKFSTRFRLESCILASKQLASTGDPELITPKARWLKENCPQGLSVLS